VSDNLTKRQRQKERRQQRLDAERTAATRARRRSRTLPTAIADTERAWAEAAYAAFVDDTAPVLRSASGERLEAALALLHEARVAPMRDQRAEDRALPGVVRALRRTEAEAWAEARRGLRAVAAAPSAPRRRSLAWGGLAVGFVALLAAGLTTGVGPRLAGRPPTGTLPVAAAEEQPDVDALAAAAQERPDDPRAWRALGDAAATDGQFARAVDAYQRALRLDGDQDDVRVSLAAALLNTPDASDALDQLDRVLRRNPDHAEALLLLGLVADRGGDRDSARVALERFLRVAPDHPGVPMARKLLDEPRAP
jgi:cytochrome c-type biogenesis protein CcmH